MANRGASIRIFLADDTPEGLRILDKPNWTGVALACSRAQYPEIRHRVELGRTANGRIEWTDEQGRTLKELQESAVEGSAA